MKVSLWAEIRRLHEVERLSQAAIARRLHCHHRTVRKALAMASPPAPTREPHESVLDAYHAQIDTLVAKYPDLSAVRVFEEIARGEDGYRGSVYPVRRYLHKIRPSRGRVYQEVVYEPGEAMQVDWGDCGRLTIGQTPRRVSVFVAVLCYSRMGYIEFSLAQRKADFYRALVHALEFFQGSPRKVILDNLKSAVLGGSGRYACFHPEFLALCGYFCLEPIACAARDPESKGIVENGVRYVKHSALAGRSDPCSHGPSSPLVLQRACTEWLPSAASGPRPCPELRRFPAAVMQKDGGGPSLCMKSRHRRHRGQRFMKVAATIPAAQHCSTPADVPSRAILRLQPTASPRRNTTAAHKQPETAAHSKPAATPQLRRRLNQTRSPQRATPKTPFSQHKLSNFCCGSDFGAVEGRPGLNKKDASLSFG